MISNRTANFKTNGKEEEEEEEMKINDKDFVKLYTTPLPKFDMNFHFKDEVEKENSCFSFKNDLLNKNAYNFIKRKDECLAAMVLDDTIPTTNLTLIYRKKFGN